MERKHVVIIGGGTAGNTVAARLLRAGVRRVTVIEPSRSHWYQPALTLVGAGLENVNGLVRDVTDVLPRKAERIRARVASVRPHSNIAVLDDGTEVRYDYLVVAPGMQMDWHKTPGLLEGITDGSVCSNYGPKLAPKTWEAVQRTTSGTAVFTLASGPVKCAGAGQKIAYLAADHWRRWGVRSSMDIHLVMPGDDIFGIPEYAAVLHRTVEKYGINLHLASELAGVDGQGRRVTIRRSDGTTQQLAYDFLHAVPMMSAPSWLGTSGLSNDGGFVDVDPYTLRHVRFPNIFSLGDAAGSPNAKTGAAVRKQAPVVVAGVLAAMNGGDTSKRYGGYACCPIPTGLNSILLAEFDYSGRVCRGIPGGARTIWDPMLRVIKRTMLPRMYWHGMMPGLV